MNPPDQIRVGVALALATMTTTLVFTAGLYGQAGAWLFGTFVSTFLIALLGGRRRVLLTAIATIPPHIIIYIQEIRLRHPEPLDSVLVRALGTFGLLVVIPLAINYGFVRLTRNDRNA